MELTAQIAYPASPQTVFAMLVDRSFQERVCLATGARRHQVDVQQSGGGATLTVEREMSSADLPDFVRKFAGETLTVRRTDRWEPAADDGSRRGAVVVEIQGAPVRFSGTLALLPDGDGTQQSIDGDLKASIPLLGGKVEEAAAPAIRAAIRKEEEVGLEQLGG